MMRSLVTIASFLLAVLAFDPVSLAAGNVPVSPPGAASVPPPATARDWPDVFSYADPDSFVTPHFDIDLEVDFDREELRGTVVLQIERRKEGATGLVLDTRDLSITSVEAAAGEGVFEPVEYSLGARHEYLGSALRVTVPEDATRVRIRYVTAPAASGLQWLAPGQTGSKRLSYLYSQAQAVHARSFVPLQDTPRIRSTYTAKLRVPRGYTAVMAAAADAGNAETGPQGVFSFHMPQPVPSYLIALAAGDLRFGAIGPRTGVWAEPAQLAPAQREFEDVEDMLATTERLYGPYRWDRYDALVLPPSFPFGGMENPRVTFMTPTVIAGDKSGVGVLAHELAHSWSGNLVTNATWRDGWLNEGFTTYFERRIMEAVYGPERAAMEWGIGEHDLREALAQLKPGEEWRSELAPDLSNHVGGEGPAASYEKGALFLRQLELRYGRESLDRFLRQWFDRHAFTSVTTPQFVDELRRELIASDPGKVDEDFVRRWIEDPGIPADAVFVKSEAFERVDAQRLAWERGELGTAGLAVSAWSALEWLHFLNGITRPQDRERMAELDSRFALTGSANAEIAHAWYRLAIASEYRAAYPAMERYLVQVGRLKLIRPLYRDLLKTPFGAEFARRVYAVARPGYHPITQRAVDRDFGTGSNPT